MGGGAWCYDGKTIKEYTTENGLNDNNVYKIIEDKKGILWFGTWSNGASRFDGKSFTTFKAGNW